MLIIKNESRILINIKLNKFRNKEVIEIEPTFYEFMELFEKNITIEYIASKLVCWKRGEEGKEDVLKKMLREDYDIIGIDDSGRRCQFLKKNGEIKDIDLDNIISESTPLTYITELFWENTRRKLFVLSRESIDGIVTIADLQKGPFCLFTFGLITNLEIACLKFIEKVCSEDWEIKLSNKKLQAVNDLFEELKEKDEEINKLQCTSLSDKKTILFKTNAFSEVYEKFYTSKTKARNLFTRIIRIRNNLAHSRKIKHNFKNWEDILETIKYIPLLTSGIREIILK